jgi:hypothetical protein
MKIKLLKIKNKLRRFESIFSTGLLVSITSSTILAMLAICHFSTKDKPFNLNFFQTLSLLNFCFGFIKIFVYFHYGEEVSNSFKRLKNKLESSVRLISYQTMNGSIGSILKIWNHSSI